ncbi:MAG: hypothetical protein ABSA83_24150 [Verrucomicrobiota bacterium]|jgi:hypothetical protein
MNDHEVKLKLISGCLTALNDKVALQKHAMDAAQAEANTHKGAMSSRYDTFKEEAQALRNGHAKQCQLLGEVIAQIHQLEVRPCTKASMGAVVQTDAGNFFVSTGLVDAPITVDGLQYECIGPTTPIVQQLRGLAIGQTIRAFGREIRLIRVF